MTMLPLPFVPISQELCIPYLSFSFLPVSSSWFWGLLTRKNIMEGRAHQKLGWIKMSYLLFNFLEKTSFIPRLPERIGVLQPLCEDEWWVSYLLWSFWNQPITSLLCLPGIPNPERQNRKCILMWVWRGNISFLKHPPAALLTIIL